MYTREEHKRLMSYLNKKSRTKKQLGLDNNTPFVIQPTLKESMAKDGKPEKPKAKKKK